LSTGIDYIYGLITAAKQNQILNSWRKLMTEAGGIPQGNYTAEVTIFNNNRSIITGDPENIKALLGTAQFGDYGKGYAWFRALKDFIGHSIFTLDGELWHEKRQMMRPIFNKDRVGDLRVFEKHFQKLMVHLGPGDGSTVDIRSLFVRFSMDIAMEFLLGTDLDSLNNPDGEFAKAWDEVQQVQALIIRTG
jgi:cytochrome P450